MKAMSNFVVEEFVAVAAWKNFHFRQKTGACIERNIVNLF
jgi:hypothetical protein